MTQSSIFSSRFLLRLIGFILLLGFFTSPGFAMPAHVLLIRHGEEPVPEGRELSPKGWQRAKALPQLFRKSPVKELGAPIALIGMAPQKKQGSIRALQTLSLLSSVYQLPIVDDFTNDDVDGLIEELTKNRAFDGKLVVIAWGHKSIRELAQGLGWKKAPKWPGEQYDRMWLFDFEKGSMTRAQDLPQLLLSDDKP